MDVEEEEEEDDDVEEENQSQDRTAHFVRACAVETHMTFHKSHFAWRFTGQMPHALATLMKHRALTLTLRTPSVWPHCLGKNMLLKTVFG